MYLIGYPLWWVLGVDQLLLPAAAAIMALQLLRRRTVSVPRGFGWWLLFLAWVTLGVLLLQVDAPGAVPGGSPTRYLTFAYRMCLYLSATIFGVYIYAMRERLSTVRISRALAAMFVTVVAGGILGTVAPFLDFRSALELVLPNGLTHFRFVHDLIHPVVAQLHTSGDVVYSRTSAPFAYTNNWGLAFAFLLPFFLLAWLGPDAGWRRRIGPVILLISVYPMIMSQNRGLWIALIVSALLLCVRAAAVGRWKFVVIFIVAAVIGTAVILSTPLKNTIAQRITTDGSVNGRSSLSAQTVDSVAAKSPVLGLGTTRKLEGSFYSIAGGGTASCAGCEPPPLGTQGQLWLLLYTTGFGGTLLYLGFLLRAFLRHLRLRTPVVTAGLTVLLAHVVTMFVYDLSDLGLCVIFAAIALLWRERRSDLDARDLIERDVPLAGYLQLIRRNAVILAVCVVLGAVGGMAFQRVHGTQYHATATVLLPTDPHYAEVASNVQTLDTLAQFIDSPQAVDAVRAASGETINAEAGRLSVTAMANTRLLLVHFTAGTPTRARQGANAAAVALLAVRHTALSQQQTDAIHVVDAHRNALQAALSQLDAQTKGDPALAASLSGQRARLVSRANADYSHAQRLAAAELDPGTVVATSAATASSGALLVPVSTGVALGLLVGLALSMLRHMRSERIGRHPITPDEQLVVARLHDASLAPTNPRIAAASRTLSQTTALFAALGVRTVLNTDPTRRTCAATRALERAVARAAGSPPGAADKVVLVAGTGTRRRHIDTLRTRLEHIGVPVAGLVLVGAESTHEVHTTPAHLDSYVTDLPREIGE